MGKGPNNARVQALGRLRRRPVGLTPAIRRARVNARRLRGGEPGGTGSAVARLRRRPVGLSSAIDRADRNAARASRAR